MKDWWVKMSVSLDRHPKAITAGYVGVAVFGGVLRLHGALRGDGNIPAHFATPEYIAHTLGAPIPWVKKGLSACETAPPGHQAGFLRREPDGSLTIVGWSDEWRPPSTSADRMRALREKRTSASHVTAGDAALRPVTAGDACDAIDQTRLEETRGRKDPESPLAMGRTKDLSVADILARRKA